MGVRAQAKGKQLLLLNFLMSYKVLDKTLERNSQITSHQKLLRAHFTMQSLLCLDEFHNRVALWDKGETNHFNYRSTSTIQEVSAYAKQRCTLSSQLREQSRCTILSFNWKTFPARQDLWFPLAETDKRENRVLA